MINEMQPYACVRCGKPFGTLKAIEAMLGKLAAATACFRAPRWSA